MSKKFPGKGTDTVPSVVHAGIARHLFRGHLHFRRKGRNRGLRIAFPGNAMPTSSYAVRSIFYWRGAMLQS